MLFYNCRLDSGKWSTAVENITAELILELLNQEHSLSNSWRTHSAEESRVPLGEHCVNLKLDYRNNWFGFIALAPRLILRISDGNSWAGTYNTCRNLDFMYPALSCACPRSGPSCIRGTWSHRFGHYYNTGSLVSAKRPSSRQSVHSLRLHIHSSYSSDIYLWNTTPGRVGSGLPLRRLWSKTGHALEAQKPLNLKFYCCKVKQSYFTSASVVWKPEYDVKLQNSELCNLLHRACGASAWNSSTVSMLRRERF